MPNRVFSIFFSVTIYLIICQIAFGQNLNLNLHASGISDRDLLGIGQPLTRILNLSSAPIQTNDLPDTLRILAIRVEFQEDNTPLTTGTGKFDLSSSIDTNDLLIDPPPHDLNYFEHQLLALTNYFSTASHGKLVLQAEVFPKEPNASYTVANEMSFYSPTGSEDLLDQRLSELFQEGMQLTDARENIDFAQFDSFIIFHAGVGADFALDFDPTPQDVPSVFLDHATLQKFLGNNDPAYPGISVNEGRAFIRDGIILPETQNQEGFKIALLGTMAIMFGHQLGLPNLFNTDSGRTGIGVFGLMDQGSGNFFGLLPAEPCAWSKIFLGWETAIEVKNGEGLTVAAPQTMNPNKIYKIPIASKEYFLIENRNRDFNNDGVAFGRDANGTRVEFRWDAQGQRLLTEAPIGVITQVSEFDFGLPVRFDSTGRVVLPGTGILIWHIDERVLAANYASNRVNANPDRRGVDLEEADGAQDIGQFYGFLDNGFGSENGVAEDAWWASNPVITQFLRPGEPVTFSAITSPSSNSNDGAVSHIEITDFSEPDAVMTFSVRENISQPGFPQFMGTANNAANSPLITDLNHDGLKEIICSANKGTDIFVWNTDGAKFIANQDTGQILKFNGEVDTYPLAIFARPQGSRSFSPAVASLNDRGVVIAVTDEVVAAYLPEDMNSDGRADSLFVFASSAKLTTPPLVIDSEANLANFNVIVGTGNGDVVKVAGDGTATVIANVAQDEISGLALHPLNRIAFTSRNGEIGLLALDGIRLWQQQTNTTLATAPVIGDLNRDGRLNIIAVSNDGDIYAYDENGDLTAGFPVHTHVANPSHVALGDIDGDIFLNIVFVTENKLYSFNHAGFLSNHFPIQINRQDENNHVTQSSPILADLDEDGLPEIITGSAANQLVAFHFNGQQVAGFPLATGHAVNSTPTVADIDNDGSIEMAAAADDGFIYVWNLSGNLNPENIPWGSFLHDAQHSNADLDLKSAPPSVGELMPANLVYNYPNPTEGTRTTIRYRLNYAAEVNIKIYDLAGELIDELTGPGFGQVENEIDWQLDAIESGVYLARVEAQGNGKKDVVIFKIAVVK